VPGQRASNVWTLLSIDFYMFPVISLYFIYIIHIVMFTSGYIYIAYTGFKCCSEK
jgi:hypothetical protein